MNSPQEFADLLAALRRLEANGFSGGAALATLTRTRGSTFRRPGACMLILGDGTVIRALSGGCPQRDIAMRARRVIASGQAELIRYNSESGLDVLMEMGCGGELEVLIEPLTGSQDLRFVSAIERCFVTRRNGFMATAFARGQHCLAPRPRRLVWADDILSSAILSDAILNDATLIDDFADAALCTTVMACAASMVAEVRTTVVRVGSGEQMIDVLIERLDPPHALILLGLNASSLALSRMAVQMGWVTTLVDTRDDRPERAELAPGVSFVCAGPDTLHHYVHIDPRTSVVAMTHNIEQDIAFLGALRDTPAGYMGAIGSRERAATMQRATGLGQRLRAPAGLDLGSDTPEEIALAIAAEILAATMGRVGGVLSTSHGPLH
jgi:xanthine dehydrogenase accessory factor